MSGRRQRGMATLLTAIVLLALMSLIAITFNRSAMMEQRMMGSVRRSIEVEAAAEGAMSWFSAWLAENPLAEGNWVDDPAVADTLWQLYSNPPTPPTVNYANGYAYTPVLTLTRSTADTTRFRTTVSISAADAEISMRAWFDQNPAIGLLPGGWR